MDTEKPWQTSAALATASQENLAVDASVILAATFTADPLVEPFNLFMLETGLELSVVVAPYGQVFQELLDRTRLFSQNRNGVNVLLVRFEDWVRQANGDARVDDDRGRLQALVGDLLSAVREAALALPTPMVVCVCPSNLQDSADQEARDFLASLETTFIDGIRSLPSVHVLSRSEIGPLDDSAIYDPETDRLGHLPYTPAFFTSLAMALARLVHALRSSPRKVLVLDCDNTLWKGGVGEDGVRGVEITSQHRALQSFALEKKNGGMLLCLASKNLEAEVTEVLRDRQEMVLRADDLVSTRVNWLPKSENLKSLAAELNLGLDSFVLIDDNPVECAEVEAHCPEVLVLRLPVEDDFPKFLANVWPLDRLQVTEEDRRRTEAYRQNGERVRLQATATSFSDFIEGLELRIEIAQVRPEQHARVAQLTQRTNQFNLTTQRRTEGEIALLAGEGKECWVVEVKDRFGDYGLVGAAIFGIEGSTLALDTLLLSCRVLGRGVEHAILRQLGKTAETRGLSWVTAPFIPTDKNLPARLFLNSLPAESVEETEHVTRYRFGAGQAAAAVFAPSQVPAISPTADSITPITTTARNNARSAHWNRIARDLDTPQKVLAILDGARHRQRASRDSLAPPRTDTERKLCSIWAQELRVSEVGVKDDYFDLGGTSIVAVAIFARIEREIGRRLSLAALVECKTIEALASRIDNAEETTSVVVLERGSTGLPLFLIHDADGETLLYRNLARRLGGRPVYGIQPQGREGVPMVHTRIEEMAAHYVAEIRRVRPQGPYLLGGLCAGGILASEVARQLEVSNEEARLVAIFDAADADAPLKHNLESTRRMTRMKQAIGAQPIARVPALFLAKATGYLGYQVRKVVRGAYDRVSIAALRRYLDRGATPPHWVRKLSVRAVYSQAQAEYHPRHVLREEIVLFRATTGVGLEEPYVQIYADPLLGWADRSAKGVKAIDVPGGHGSMLQEPHVATLANELFPYLAKADRDVSSRS